MARSRQNFIDGVVSDNPLTIGATTLNSPGLASLAAITGPATAMIVLDPQAIFGAPEIVTVTAHTASATSATITRGQLGTTARQHNQNTQWVHALLVDDPAYLDAANTFTAGQTITAGGIAVTGNSSITGTLGTSGALTVTAGGLTVSAGGAAITGNTSVTGTLTASSTLTVSAGGITVTGNSSVTGTLTTSAKLTVTAGGLLISAGSIQAKAADNYFGPYADGTGTTVERIHISDNAGVSMTIAVEGDSGNRNLNFKTFGSGGTFQWQTDAAGTGMTFNPTSGGLQVLVGGITSKTGGVTKFSVDTSGNVVAVGNVTSNGKVVSGGTLGYAEITASSSTFSTMTAISGLSTTVTTISGHRVRVSSDLLLVNLSGATTLLRIAIYKDGSQVALRWISVVPNQYTPLFYTFIDTPTAASHTYDVRCQIDTGTGQVVAAANQASYILAEDIGV